MTAGGFLLVASLQAQATAFVGVSLIPMDRNRILTDHTVVVSEGRITALGPAASVTIPAGARTIDGRGKFLMPGLGDAHAHLSLAGGGPGLAALALQLYALNGVTMVRSMYTEPHHAGVRSSVEKGEIVGPRALLVSPAVMGQLTPQAAGAAVRRYSSEGYRIIKVLPGLSVEAFDTVAVEARKAGIPLAGHVPFSVGLPRVLTAGYQSIEHLDGLLEALVPVEAGITAASAGFFGFGVLSAVDETRLPALVQAIKRSGVTIVPTEVAMERFVSVDSGDVLARRPELRYVPDRLVAQWTTQKDNFARGVGVTAEKSARYRELRRTLIRELHAAGVPIALGSDAFNLFDVPGFAVFDELETYVAAGLSPFDALVTSTTGVARLMGLPNVTGTIATGSMADLVLLDANPLADISNVRRQAGVMLRGEWLPRAELDRRLNALMEASP